MSSELTDALNRILSWIEQHKPWFVEYLQPGLSRAEIEELVKILPVQIPQEVYELYQWRNGAAEGDPWNDTAWLFENWTFIPLQEVVTEYERNKSHLDEIYKKNPDSVQKRDLSYLSNFQDLKIFYALDLEDSLQGCIWVNTILEFCPIILAESRKDSFCFIKKYTSLTSMMLTMAECYETGAYYHDPEADAKSSYSRSYIRKNAEKEYQIWLKYNSSLGEFALQTLTSVFKPIDLVKRPQLDHKLELLEFFSEELVEFKDSRTVELLIHAIQTSTQRDGELVSVTYFIKRAVEILGELGDTRAVPALIAILDLERDFCNIRHLKDWREIAYSMASANMTDESEAQQMGEWALKEIRKMAAWALGEIGDIRVVEPLIDASWDSDKEVKKAASKALIKLIAKFPELDEKIPF